VKLSIFGDSLSSKRSENNDIEEWPSLISQKYEVVNFSRPFQTSDSLKRHKGLSGKAIINLGLVDCSERRFSKFEHKLLARMPTKLRQLIISKLNREPSLHRAYVREPC
jgi:hypothetical protein